MKLFNYVAFGILLSIICSCEACIIDENECTADTYNGIDHINLLFRLQNSVTNSIIGIHIGGIYKVDEISIVPTDSTNLSKIEIQGNGYIRVGYFDENQVQRNLGLDTIQNTYFIHFPAHPNRPEDTDTLITTAYLGAVVDDENCFGEDLRNLDFVRVQYNDSIYLETDQWFQLAVIFKQ